jgi:MoaA/NifB/PqqE/SkfB family radical SAM enzyme
MSPELQKAYDDSCIPYMEGGGAIGVAETRMRSWRYFLEINSACTLKCPSCTKGNVEGYEHENGFMDWSLMERILDKIKSENPSAIVFTYGNSEPFVHPRLAECIAAIKSRGLRAEFSTNLNFVRRLDDVLAARPDFIIISVSGFYQETYVKGHAGGDIEKVKANMKLLSEAHARAEHKTNISVNFHVYNDNGHEVELMEEYAKSLGINFFTSLARAISMENTLQYCRSKDPESTPYEIQEGRPDWNKALPPIGKTYIETMDRLRIPPDKARAMYAHVPVSTVCPVGAGSMFTFIRHDGKTSMCACVADRRITVGDYLDTTPEKMMEQRTGHAICQQCLKYRTNLYFHIVDREKWTP